MADDKKLIDEVAKMGDSSLDGSMSGWRDLATLAVSPVSIPLALTLMVAGHTKDAFDKSRELTETAMPDEWLREVAETNSISKEGLAHLSKCLTNKGFVSIKDAQEWVRIEEAEAKKSSRKTPGDDEPNSEGAEALLSRAKQECSSMLNLDVKRSINKAVSKGQSIVDSVARLSKKDRTK